MCIHFPETPLKYENSLHHQYKYSITYNPDFYTLLNYGAYRTFQNRLFISWYQFENPPNLSFSYMDNQIRSVGQFWKRTGYQRVEKSRISSNQQKLNQWYVFKWNLFWSRTCTIFSFRIFGYFSFSLFNLLFNRFNKITFWFFATRLTQLWMFNIFFVAMSWVQSNLTETSHSLLTTAPFSNWPEVAPHIGLFKAYFCRTHLKVEKVWNFCLKKNSYYDMRL